MSIFGFSTEASSGGDFLPVVKYDGRSGRMFRVDRDNIAGEWVTSPVDITKSFKAVLDLENLETGWLDFGAGRAPVMSLVKRGDQLPPKPTPEAKNGVRVMLKLASSCGGEKPIRELAGNSKVFLQGLEAVTIEYDAQKAGNGGKLPVVVLEDTVPVTSGNGATKSTNYRPVFKIVGWHERGDLVWSPKNGQAATPVAASAPSTGSTVVAPPAAKALVTADEDDF